MNTDRSCPSPTLPLLLPLGDRALLVRFGSTLSEQANRAAIGFAERAKALGGAEEVVPNLVSVMIRFDLRRTTYETLAGEVRLLLGTGAELQDASLRRQEIAVHFGGEAGPDLGEVANSLALSQAEFIQQHNATELRVLATGFAPGFVYCGFHPESLHVARRSAVHARVPAGSVLFAAGQTAITSTPIPTGWHVIGRTDFINFNPGSGPPTQLKPGDRVRFRSEPR